MFKPNDYHSLYGKEAVGSHGRYGVKIEVAVSPKLPNLDNPRISSAAWKAGELVEDAIMRTVIEENPEDQLRARNERKDILGLFAPAPIFVEEIPNGYCNRWCCAHLPWFVVTTHVGKIKIGWRKRVINIEWDDTKNTKTSSELFLNEDVTKSEWSIHAWGLEDAKLYLNAIITGTPLVREKKS